MCSTHPPRPWEGRTPRSALERMHPSPARCSGGAAPRLSLVLAEDLLRRLVLLGWPPLPNDVKRNWLSALAIEKSMPLHIITMHKLPAVLTSFPYVQALQALQLPITDAPSALARHRD